MSEPTILITDVAEGTTPRLTFTVIDDTGAAVQPGGIALTVYDEDTETVLTASAPRDVLSLVTLGVASVPLTVAETAIVDSDKKVEWHRAWFHFTYGASGVGDHEVRFRVVNLVKPT